MSPSTDLQTATDTEVLWVSTSLGTRGGVSSVVREFTATPLWSDWHIRHIATHRDGSVPTRVWTYLAALITVAVTLIRRPPALMHLHTASYGSFIRKSLLLWLARLRRVPVVLHVHGAEFHLFHDRAPRLLQAYIAETLSAADCVIALGPQWRTRLLAIAPRAHVEVLPNSVRVSDDSVPHRAGEPVRVVFLGRVGDRKGTFTLLDAWAQRSAPVPAQLTIAGDGELDRARTVIADNGMSESVSLTGWLSPEATEALLCRADILVLPSRNEGLPMAVLEAMAHGVTVIATPVGDIPDVLDTSSGVLIPVDDPAALAAALDALLIDDARRTRLGDAARERIRERFDINAATATLDSIYQRILR